MIFIFSCPLSHLFYPVLSLHMGPTAGFFHYLNFLSTTVRQTLVIIILVE